MTRKLWNVFATRERVLLASLSLARWNEGENKRGQERKSCGSGWTPLFVGCQEGLRSESNDIRLFLPEL